MQGRLDMKVGQISGITTFTPGLNCPLPVNLLPYKVDSIAKLQQTNRNKALLKAIFTLLLRYYSIIKIRRGKHSLLTILLITNTVRTGV